MQAQSNEDAQPARSSRASRLLERLLDVAELDAELIAAELVTEQPTLDEWAAGRTAMPYDRQLCLAHFVIDKVPALKREGHRLLSQVRAALDYESGATSRSVEPPSRFRRN